MDSATENLTKLAQELIQRLDVEERRNEQLTAQLNAQTKQAQAAKCVSEDVAQATCEQLLKHGGITEDQLQQTKEAFLTQPEAAHRALVGVLESMDKEPASSKQSVDLTGGKLVGVSKQAAEDSLDNIQAILGLPL